MTAKIPLKANFTGSDVTSLGEFVSTDSIAVAHGGTGGVTAAEARTNLGVDAAGTVNYSHPDNQSISVITGLQTALDGKIDDSQVLTNVPSGAVFTDTNTTYSIGDGGLTQVNFTTADNTKLDGIAASANNYSHPANHAISVTTGLQTALDAALPKAGGTMSGLVNMADQIVQRPVLKDYAETKVAMGANDVNLTLGNVFTKTISGAQTLTFSNPPASGSAGSFTLLLTNGGSAAVTWPTSVDWPAATAPTLTAAGVDVLVFSTIDGGTIWYGIASGIGMA